VLAARLIVGEAGVARELRRVDRLREGLEEPVVQHGHDEEAIGGTICPERRR
jgi:hypothetical protein